MMSTPEDSAATAPENIAADYRGTVLRAQVQQWGMTKPRRQRGTYRQFPPLACSSRH
jgi:hypothetical protein